LSIFVQGTNDFLFYPTVVCVVADWRERIMY